MTTLKLFIRSLILFVGYLVIQIWLHYLGRHIVETYIWPIAAEWVRQALIGTFFILLGAQIFSSLALGFYFIGKIIDSSTQNDSKY